MLKHEDINGLFACIFIVLSVILLGTAIGYSIAYNKIRKEAISLEYAGYNSNTGVWEWRNKPDMNTGSKQ